MERIDLLRVVVARSRQNDRAGEKAIRFPAGARVIEFVEPAHVERGTGQQHHRERELRDDQRVTETSMTAPTRRAAAATLQRLRDIEAKREERGSKAERDRGNDRRAESPTEDIPVQ